MQKFVRPGCVLGAVAVTLAITDSAVAASATTPTQSDIRTFTAQAADHHRVSAFKFLHRVPADLHSVRGPASRPRPGGAGGPAGPSVVRERNPVTSPPLSVSTPARTRLGAAAAQVAPTLSITFGADPTEEVFTAITATWSSTESNLRVIVTSKAGSRGCGSTYAADHADSTVWINRLVGSSGSTSRYWRLLDPGTATLCGYLYRAGEPVLLAATGPVPLTYRAGRASVAIEVPPRVSPGQIFQFFVPVSAELRRHLEVTLKPAGSRGCGASYPLDDPVSTDLIYGYMQGDQRYAKTIRASGITGTYLLCAYVSERPTDPSPEAAFAATFEVGPDLCAEARAQLAAASHRLISAQSSVTRYRTSYERYARRARRTHATYRRLARRDKSRYARAVGRRKAARVAAAFAQAEVRAACEGN